MKGIHRGELATRLDRKDVYVRRRATFTGGALVAFDVFTPPREDWINGEDACLRPKLAARA